MSLHPVRFRYNVYGPDSPLQYGLVAEDVALVAPDLVARNKDGKIETVFYDKVNAILLNQVQVQQRLIDANKKEFSQTVQAQEKEFTQIVEAQQERFTGRLQAQAELIRQMAARLEELEKREK